VISHRHKTILVHIPRTGGSSIEKLIVGDDMWGLGLLHEKHLSASQLKEKYADYWDDYFKFAFIRNPWEMVVSRYHMPFNEDCNAQSGNSLLYFLKNVILPDWEMGSPQCSAYINEEIDFIGRYENYDADRQKVLDIVGVENRHSHIEKTEHRHYSEYYDDETRELVAEMFADDIRRFGYEF
jgi:hypothetical protein